MHSWSSSFSQLDTWLTTNGRTAQNNTAKKCARRIGQVTLSALITIYSARDIEFQQRQSALAGPFRDCARGNLAHSCLLKASFTAKVGSPDTLRGGMIQAQSSHPHAAKVLFSNHTNFRPIIGKFLTNVRYRT